MLEIQQLQELYQQRECICCLHVLYSLETYICQYMCLQRIILGNSTGNSRRGPYDDHKDTTTHIDHLDSYDVVLDKCLHSYMPYPFAAILVLYTQDHTNHYL